MLMDDKFAEWIRSGVVVGLLPVFVNLLAIVFTPLPWSPWVLIGRGELLMLSVGLSVGALLDIPAANMKERVKDWYSLVCLVCVFGALITYAMTVSNRAYGDPANEVAVSVVSLAVYIPSVYASARCVAAVERRGW